MADKRVEYEHEVTTVYVYKDGRREVRKQMAKTGYGGQPTHSQAEVDEFLRKRREGES